MGLPKNFTNWKVIVLCFIGATTFWFFSALGKNYNYRIKYPISFAFNRDSLVAIKPLPKYVDIDVSGGGWDLFKQSFGFTDPINFELQNPLAIRHLTRPSVLPILREQLTQFQINFLFTDTLYLSIDRKTTKKVALGIDSTKIDLEKNHRIISPIAIQPDSVIIFGPESFLDSLIGRYQIKIARDEIDEDFSREVNVSLPQGYGIRSEPEEVKINFKVDRFNNREIPTKVENINFPDDSSVYITNPNVIVKYVVQESKEKEFTQEDFKVVIDHDMIFKADSTAPAIIIFQPEEVLEVMVEPDTLSISYAKEP